MLGTLFLALGLAAGVAAAFRSARRDRALLWFGVFTALYGLRLIVRSDTVQTEFPFPATTWDAIEALITYVILVPAALLAASAATPDLRGLLRHLWRVNLACAVVASVWDIAAGRPGAAMVFNRMVVVANIGIALLSVTRDLRARRVTGDGWIVLSGAAVFVAAALLETARGRGFGPVQLEPFAMLVVVACLGYVVVKQVFDSERRIAAVGRELETARQIQQSILPKRVPPVPGVSVAAHYDSMSEVAGDLYDFVVTPSGQLGILVADVSGHGVPAAIVASMVKIALAVQEGEISDPGTVLARMNRALYGRFELAYVTAVFALIDPAARTLTYASAGHPSPMLRRGDGRIESLDERGIVIGFLPEVGYASAVVRDLAAGDRVVFYTDGMTEAARADGEFFGDREFQRILATGAAPAPEQCITLLVDAARRWVGADFADDVTVIVVDWISARGQLPAGVDPPLALAHEDFRGGAPFRGLLAVRHQVHLICRVENHRGAIGLELGAGKHQPRQLAAAGGEGARRLEIGRAGAEPVRATLDRDQFRRQEVRERASITGEPRAPHRFARGQHRRPLRLAERSQLRDPAVHFLRMQRGVRGDLDPALRLFVEDVQQREPLRELRPAIRHVDVEQERGHRRVAVEDDVEVGHAVADHADALGRRRVEGRFVHVAVEAANHVIGLGREPPPVLAVRFRERLAVLVDERLADVLDLLANERPRRPPGFARRERFAPGPGPAPRASRQSG